MGHIPVLNEIEELAWLAGQPLNIALSREAMWKKVLYFYC